MASERQITANRRNAGKSRGPLSLAGKKRVSRNAYRHGLSLNIGANAAFAKQLDSLARKIARDTKSAITFEGARAVAEAELDLARVRQAKVSLIERVSAFGELDHPHTFSSAAKSIRFLTALVRGSVTISEPVGSAARMPSEQLDRLAEAIRRALPDLVKLERYERRASARRDRTVQTVFGRSRGSYYNL